MSWCCENVQPLSQLLKPEVPLAPGSKGPLCLSCLEFSFFRAVSPALRGSNWGSFVPHSLCQAPGVAELLSTARHMRFGLFHSFEHLPSKREGWAEVQGERKGDRLTEGVTERERN